MTARNKTVARKLGRRNGFDARSSTHAGWQVIEIANRLFGPDGWSREVMEMRCAASRERGGAYTTAYVARIRLCCRVDGADIVREAHGCGEGHGENAFGAHDRGLKAAELDATLRAFATFGKALGLEAFLPPKQPSVGKPSSRPQAPAEKPSEAAPDETSETLGDNSKAPLPNRNHMALPKQPRQRSPAHLRYVRQQPCLVCGKSPVDAHHLRFAQPRAMARKVSDEFTVPLCRHHHELLHRDPDEPGWWNTHDIDPLAVATQLWSESAKPNPAGVK